MKKVLILSANPNKASFSSAIASSYRDGCEKAGHISTLVHIHDLRFDEELLPHKDREKDVKKQQKLISEADHIVMVSPLWWNYVPAKMKGYLDRIFISGFAYKYPHPNKILKHFMAQRLLKGKTGHIITTQDSYRITNLLMGSPIGLGLRLSMFWFNGIWPVKYTVFSAIKKSSPKKREQILEKSFRLGNKL